MNLHRIAPSCLANKRGYRFATSPNFDYERLAEDEGLELSSAYTRQFSRLRPYRLGLILHRRFWQERQDLNLHKLVWNQSGYRYLTLPRLKLVHGEGLEPPKSVKTSDLQSEAFAALPTMRKFGIVKNKRAHGRTSLRRCLDTLTARHFSEGCCNSRSRQSP